MTTTNKPKRNVTAEDLGLAQGKHTPGPWQLRDDETPWTGDETIAYLPWLPIASKQEQDNLRANARLIAAAPEFESASHSTTKRLGDLPRFLRVNGYETLAAIVENELLKHHAAIAKAEGRD